jgi:hypothetical protein
MTQRQTSQSAPAVVRRTLLSGDRFTVLKPVLSRSLVATGLVASLLVLPASGGPFATAP